MNLAVAEPRRPFRIRWWMWVIAVVLVLTSLALALRVHGMINFNGLMSDIRASGLPVDAETLIARAPAVDATRQAQLLKLMQSRAPWPEGISKQSMYRDLDEPRPDPARTAAVASALAAGASDVAELARIMDQGPIVVSTYGWIERDPASLRQLTIAELSTASVPNLLMCRGFAQWWALEARRADDPEPALSRLDAWCASHTCSAILIDSMVEWAVAEIRDDIHLWLATRDRLDPARLQRWAGEPPLARELLAQGFDGERCLYWGPSARMPIGETWDLIGMSSILASPSAWWEKPVMYVSAWPLQGHDCAEGAATVTAMAQALRGTTTTATRARSPFSWSGPIARFGTANLQQLPGMAIEREAQHRLTRASAVIAVHYRGNRALPATNDIAPLLVRLRSDDLELGYEILSPSRFRVGVVTGARSPFHTSPGSITTRMGQPAIRQPSRCERLSLEIDLDAILIPPPEKPAKAKAKK